MKISLLQYEIQNRIPILK